MKPIKITRQKETFQPFKTIVRSLGLYITSMYVFSKGEAISGIVVPFDIALVNHIAIMFCSIAITYFLIHRVISGERYSLKHMKDARKQLNRIGIGIIGIAIILFLINYFFKQKPLLSSVADSGVMFLMGTYLIFTYRQMYHEFKSREFSIEIRKIKFKYMLISHLYCFVFFMGMKG